MDPPSPTPTNADDTDNISDSDPHPHLSTDDLFSLIDSYLKTIDNRLQRIANTSSQPQQQLHDYRSRRKFLYSLNTILLHSRRLVSMGSARAFVHGIIDHKGHPYSAASENLLHWWKDEVNFDHSGPTAVQLYNSSKNDGNSSNPETLTLKSLHCIQDSTLSSIISCIIQRCRPPQRSSPFDRGVPVAWWPTGEEEWWGEVVGENMGPPPYKKPHDLRKGWKVAILTAAMRNLAPDFEGMKRAVAESNTLQNKMTVKENEFWLGVVRGEEVRYEMAARRGKNGDDGMTGLVVRGESSKRGEGGGSEGKGDSVSRKSIGLLQEPQITGGAYRYKKK